MAKKKKPVGLPLEESRRLQGSAAELEKFQADKARKAEEAKLPTAEDIVASRVDTPAPKTPKKSKPKKSRTVVRNPETGRAEKPTPVDITKPVERTADPVIKKFKKGQLVTVKPRRQKKQTPIPTPKPGQVGKLEGQVVRVTPENATQIYEERRRTTLPVATPEDMTPAGRPAVQPVVLPSRLRGSQNKKNLGGFARSHKEVAGVAHEALGHLQTMAQHEPGTPEHHDAHESFNVLHAKLGQISNSNFHKFMGMGRTIVTQHRDKNMAKALEVHKQGVEGKLEEGRIAEQSRGERSREGGNNGS